MDKKLYEASIKGDVESLLKLIQEDQLILDRNITTTHLETPLHIAAMLGHEKFAVELMKRKPEMAGELDTQRSSPLHLASAKGHLGIVKACLRINQDMCSSCDGDGRNPVHVAAMRGKIDVLKELLRVKPDAGRSIVECNSQSVLHICVEFGQFEVLKYLIETGNFRGMINQKDKNGNTILHLAVAHKQTQTAEYLLGVSGIEHNALNLSGMTSMDILVKRGRDVRDIEIQEYFEHSGINLHSADHMVSSSKKLRKRHAEKQPKKPREWVDRKRDALMVVASLIATMAFQVAVNPPQTVLQVSNTADSPSPSPLYHSSIRFYVFTSYTYLKQFMQFYMINTISFIASLSIIMLLMSGLPIKNRFFMWMLMVITWIAISSIALSYTISVILLTPSSQENSVEDLIGITVFIWLCLMALLLAGHTIRLVFKILKQIFRMVKVIIRPFVRRRRRGRAIGSSV